MSSPSDPTGPRAAGSSDDSAPSAEQRRGAEALLEAASHDGRLAAAEADQRRVALRTATSVGQLRALTADLETAQPGPGTVNDDA